jgi:molecular chaperone GrpE
MSEEQDQLDNNPDHLPEGTSEAVIDSEPENSLPVVSIEGLQAEIGDIQQQLAEQEQQVDSLKKRYITLAAEFDNYRKRTAKEKEDIERQVKAKTLSELLAIVDNFERARTQIKPDTEAEMSIHKSYQGVYKTLVDSLKRLGVSAMRPEGQMFDPNYHEAMLREYTNEHPEGTIIEQLVRGYLLDDTVLRHAMVKVTALPEPNAADGDDSPREPQSETSV